MNRISLGLAILIALAFAGPAAQAERVMSGAMDICKAVDGGEVTINGDVESCCAQERVEYDDGIEIDGPVYCVACVIGTDWCHRSDLTRSKQETLRNLKKALSTTPKQGTVTGN